MKISKELFDELQGLNLAMINKDGKEMLNPMPIEIPSTLKKPLSLEERIALLIKGGLSAQAEQQEYESLDESNDFDLNDELVAELSGFELSEDEIPIMTDVEEPKADPEPDKATSPAEPILDNNNPENQGP